MPLKRYADFQGRSRRKEYWMFVLLQVLVLVPLVLLIVATSDTSVGADPFEGIVGISLILLFALVFFIPSLAVQVRRFHDQDKSGWFVLLGMIPYLGGLIMLVFMCIEGTKGPNRFGPDPKDPYAEDVFA